MLCIQKKFLHLSGNLEKNHAELQNLKIDLVFWITPLPSICLYFSGFDFVKENKQPVVWSSHVTTRRRALPASVDFTICGSGEHSSPGLAAFLRERGCAFAGFFLGSQRRRSASDLQFHGTLCCCVCHLATEYKHKGCRVARVGGVCAF